MLRVHKAKIKQLLANLLSIRDEANNISVDFEEFKENIKQILNWKDIVGNNSEAYKQLKEKVEEIEGKSQENVWLRGRTEILTSERDSLMILNETLKANNTQLADITHKNFELSENLNSLNNKLNLASKEKQIETQEKLKLQEKFQEAEKKWIIESSELKSKISELTIVINQMKEREENCIRLEAEDRIVKNHFVELNANIQTLEYERSVLELQSEEYMKKLENEKRKNELLDNQISEIHKKYQQKEDKIKENIKILETEINVQKSRAVLAEDKLRANSHKSMLEAIVNKEKTREDELEMEGTAGQEKQLQIFVESFTDFSNTLELYNSILLDELSMRIAIKGTEIEQVFGYGKERSHISFDTPSALLIQTAQEIEKNISPMLKQLTLLRKLLRKLANEGENWGWRAQSIEHLKDVAFSIQSCLFHSVLTVVACVCPSYENGKKLSFKERLEKLKKSKKERSKKGYDSVKNRSLRNSQSSNSLDEDEQHLLDSD
eukprot:c20978_g2_i1.p1 GENE.c20978_g2_i1~~c20978_g2_i1.p1  ORF type:complete len:534 (-),score=223.21 c20978_g2_i1:41-1522(-)